MRVALAGCLLLIVMASGVFARNWTDKTGKFRVDAELVGVADGKVTLRRADNGKEITLPLAGLSAADRKFLRDAAAETDKPEPRPTPAAKRVSAEQALARPGSIKLQEEPLAEALSQLGDQSGCNIVFDAKALADAGVNGNTPISITAKGTLDQVLPKLLEPLELAHLVSSEVVLVTTSEEASGRLEARIYRLQRGVEGLGIITDLQGKISPSSWSSVGGPASIGLLPDGFLIAQTPTAHRQIAAQYARLMTPVVAPAPRGAPISVEFIETPLADAVANIAALAKIEIRLDQPALDAAGVANDTPVTLRLKDVSPQAVVALLTAQLSLTSVRDKSNLVITTAEAAAKIVVAEYDVHGLPATAGELSSAITSTIAPASWDDVGGRGSIRVNKPDVLTVHQSDAVHRQIESFFSALRTK